MTHTYKRGERDALRAIVARIRGVFDAPELQAFGPLSGSVQEDCLAIAQQALRETAA
jgi:hypothetical protein